MAKQVLLEELQGCKTYLGWIIDKVSFVYDGWLSCSNQLVDISPFMSSVISRELCRLLFETDFTWVDSVKDDEIRATDALEIRKVYAEDVGQAAGKSERDIDRIQKSVHGKASVLEVIFSLCRHLDGMVNEGESGSMIGFFYRILIHNLRLDEFSDADFGPLVAQAPNLKEAEKLGKLLEKSITVKMCEPTADEKEHEVNMIRRGAEIRKIWGARVKKWLERDYFESGCEGGMFPLYEWKKTDKDQRKVSLWYQMNAWLNEHLDDEEQFIVEKTG